MRAGKNGHKTSKYGKDDWMEQVQIDDVEGREGNVGSGGDEEEEEKEEKRPKDRNENYH